MNRPDLLKYVEGLDERVARLFYTADRIVIETNDTLSDEFQIAAAIVDVFKQQAEQHKGET